MGSGKISGDLRAVERETDKESNRREGVRRGDGRWAG